MADVIECSDTYKFGDPCENPGDDHFHYLVGEEMHTIPEAVLDYKRIQIVTPRRIGKTNGA